MGLTRNCKTICKAVIYNDIQDFNNDENGVEVIIPIEKEKLLESLGYIDLDESGIYFIQLTDAKCLCEVKLANGKE